MKFQIFTTISFDWFSNLLQQMNSTHASNHLCRFTSFVILIQDICKPITLHQGMLKL
jgi:hypothetical protein